MGERAPGSGVAGASTQRLLASLRMRSPKGFWAALVLLSAIPITAVYRMFFVQGAETLIHAALALAFALLSLAVFDFKTAPWINKTAFVATCALAGIFLLQGVSERIQSDSLTYIAYHVLGQRLETWLVYVFLLWCIAMLFLDSWGKTRVLGFIALSLAVGVQIYAQALSYAGTSLDAQSPNLKVLYLLPFAWFLLESTKKPRDVGQRQPQLESLRVPGL
jgi:hypothetical protein